MELQYCVSVQQIAASLPDWQTLNAQRVAVVDHNYKASYYFLFMSLWIQWVAVCCLSRCATLVQSARVVSSNKIHIIYIHKLSSFQTKVGGGTN